MLLPIGRTHRSGLAASNLLVAALVSSSGSAFAATVNWVTDGNGQWTNTANWSSAPVLPGITDDVVIDRPSGDWQVTLGAGSQSINSLTAEERLRIVGTLSVQTIATINNTLTLAGGTLTGGVWTFAPGRFLASVSGGRLHSTTINGDIAFDAAFSTMEFGDGLAFNGVARLNAGGTYIGVTGSRTVSVGTILFNAPASGERSAIEALSAGTSLTLGAGAVVRGGHGDIGGTLANETVLDHFTNHGLVSADRAGTSIRVLSDFTNHGSAEATTGGTLELNGGGTISNTGTIRAANGGTVRVLRTAGHGWSNTGTTQFDDGTVQFVGNFSTPDLGTIVSNSGTLLVDSGTLTNTGSTLNLPGVDIELSAGTIVGGTVNARSIKPGIIENNFLDGITLNGDIDLSDSPRDVTIRNGINFNGVASIGYGSDLRFSGTHTIASGTFRRSSGSPGAEGDLEAVNGTTTFGPASVILSEAGPNSDLRIWSLNQTGSIVTQGLVRAAGAGSSMNIFPPSFVNQGTLESVDGASITIGGSPANSTWRNEGVLRAAAGTLRLAGSFTLEPGSSIERSGNSSIWLLGRLNNTGRTLDFNSASGSWISRNGSIRGGTVNFNNGQGMVFDPAMSAGNSLMEFDGVTINGDLLVNNNGRLALSNTINLNGTVTLLEKRNDIETYGDTTINGGTIRFGIAGETNQNRVFRVLGGSLVLGPNTALEGGATEILGNATLPPLIVNHGLFHANQPASIIPGPGPLRLNAMAFQNYGTIKASNGGIAVVRADSWSNFGNLVADGGRVALSGNFTFEPGSSHIATNGGSVSIEGMLNNTGRVLNIDSPQRSLALRPSNDTRIVGGTINLSNGGTLEFPSDHITSGLRTLQDVTLNGSIERAAGMSIMDSIILNGTVSSWASGGFELLTSSTSGGTISLGGNGTIRLDGRLPDDLPELYRPELVIPRSSTTIVQPGFTVSGGGGGSISSGARFGRTHAPHQPSSIINRGTIRADVPNSVLAVSANFIDNQGLMEAMADTYLAIEGDGETTWINNGTIRANAGTVVLFGASPATTTANQGSSNPPTFINNGTIEAINGGFILYRPNVLTIDATQGNATVPIPSMGNSGTLVFRGGSDLTLSQSYEQTSTGALVLGLGGDTPAMYSGLTITGNTSLAGSLTVTLDPGFQPAWNDSFTLIQSDTLTGEFSTVNFPTLADSSLRWWFDITSTSALAGVRHFADFNHDGGVNTIDLTMMLSQFGTSGPGLLADIDRNGAVTTADLTQFLGAFGLTAGALTSVPAPGVAGLILTASLCGVSRRRRRVD